MNPLLLPAIVYIPVLVFAVLGLIFLIVCLWAMFDPTPVPDFVMDCTDQEKRNDRAFQYIDNEVRGQISNTSIYPLAPGHDVDHQPTLKGRVDAIENHLGIKVYVKPAAKETLAVKKIGKK